MMNATLPHRVPTVASPRQAAAHRLRHALVSLACAALVLPAVAVAAEPAQPRVRALIDLNHRIEDGMTTYPGASHVRFSDWQPRFPNGALLDQVSMLGITGTYIDAPYHNDPKGRTIADYRLEQLVHLPVQVVERQAARRAFTLEDFAGLDVRGKAVLLRTGHDRHFGTPRYGQDVPFLAPEAARWLADHGVALVGIDTPLIDDIADPHSAVPTHEALLPRGVVICEDMANLSALPTTGAFLTAVPPRVPMTSFPARVFATVYE